jgi:hypothetical protein
MWPLLLFWTGPSFREVAKTLSDPNGRCKSGRASDLELVRCRFEPQTGNKGGNELIVMAITNVCLGADEQLTICIEAVISSRLSSFAEALTGFLGSVVDLEAF